jgi:hypothetical protein
VNGQFRRAAGGSRLGTAVVAASVRSIGLGELHTSLSGPVIDTDDDAVGLAHFDATLLDWRVADRGLAPLRAAVQP